MGAWGAGSFENDAAMDWAGDVSSMDDVVGEIDSFLAAYAISPNPGEPVYVDADAASRLVAACEIVATAMGRVAPEVPPKIKDQFGGVIACDHPAVGLARGTLERVLYSCELADLWAEADEAGAKEWPAAVAALGERLDPNVKWSPPGDELKGLEPKCVYCNKPVAEAQRHRVDLYDTRKVQPELLYMLPCHKDCFTRGLNSAFQIQNKYD
ncbi:MAG TPA: DUF4259 domain-containing protein [Parvularculaceae bacterium]|nr:DUF4259 domain-containing protein [Parvularculaceae bacterium]